MPDSPTRLLLVDDSADVLGAMRAMLGCNPDMTVVAALQSADELRQAVETHRPDVLVVDLTMPGPDPLVEIKAITSAHPEMKAIAFSGYDDEDTKDRARAAGASGFVSKHDDLDVLVETVRKVVEGKRAF